jgi:hypothetical protein
MGLVGREGITITKFVRVVEQQLAQCGFGRWFAAWKSKLYGSGA